MKDILKDKVEKQNKDRSRRGENLSFSDILELMQHSSYKRHKGAIKQVR